MAGRGSKRTRLGVGDAGTGYTWILCGYLYAHFTHVSFLGVIIMSKWKGAVMVLTAHKYVVEAESYDEARDKIVELFENGEPPIAETDVSCYTENVLEEQD
jgi:hypothetical protein